MVNKFLIDEDPERAAARRLEIRRALAQRELNRQRIDELNAIVKKLDDDCDAADEEHSIATGKLQSELDELDEQHVDGILSGKPSSKKSLQRRSEILTELASLNTQLETRCEANRRSILPFRKQIEQLRTEVAKSSPLESELLALGGQAVRVEQTISELEIQGTKVMLNEALRRQEIYKSNLSNQKDWDELHKRSQSQQARIHSVQVDDSKKVVEHFQNRLNEALRASEESRKILLESH